MLMFHDRPPRCAYILRAYLVRDWCFRFMQRKKNDVRFINTSMCLWKESCLIHVICVCLRNTYWCPTHIVLCFCLIFLRLVYVMLSVSLDCPLLIASSAFSNVYINLCCLSSSCVPNVANFSGLSISDCLFGIL